MYAQSRAARPSGRRRVSVRGAFAPRKVLAKPFSWFRADLESSDQAPDIVWLHQEKTKWMGARRLL